MARTKDNTIMSLSLHILGECDILTLSTAMINVAASFNKEIKIKNTGGIFQSSASVMTKKKSKKCIVEVILYKAYDCNL